MGDRPTVSRGNISVFDDGTYWEIDGVRRKSEDGESIVIHIDDLKTVSLADMRSALMRLDQLDLSTSVQIVTDYDADVDLEFVPWSGISFVADKRDLVMNVEIFVDVPRKAQPSTGVACRIGPLMERKRLHAVNVEEEFDDSGSVWHVSVGIKFHIRGRTFASLVSDALDLRALVEAIPGHLTPSILCDLVRSGHAEALLGQPENYWLEVKRQHYDLRSDHGKIRLAQTVAQFANSDAGGVVIIGLESKKRDGVDTIHAVTPMPHDRDIRRKYVQIINTRVYPPIDNLGVEAVPAQDGDLILIEVSPQAEELKPFFVHGSIVDGRTQGTFISIVQRRDDEAVSSHPAAIHSMLAVGRAFLRRGSLPGND